MWNLLPGRGGDQRACNAAAAGCGPWGHGPLRGQPLGVRHVGAGAFQVGSLQGDPA